MAELKLGRRDALLGSAAVVLAATSGVSNNDGSFRSRCLIRIKTRR